MRKKANVPLRNSLEDKELPPVGQDGPGGLSYHLNKEGQKGDMVPETAQDKDTHIGVGAALEKRASRQ